VPAWRGSLPALTIGIGVFGGLAARDARGQGAPVIYGFVRTAEGGMAMPYSVVAMSSLNREQFTNDVGGFTLRELPVGPLTLRFRHVGFAPHDTTVVLRTGDTLHFDVALTRLAIRLDAMHVTAACATTQDVAASATLAELFEQVRQNAEQYRLLVRSHPFTRRMRVAEIVRTDDGKSALGAPEVLILDSDVDQGYKPGQVFRRSEGRNRDLVVALPELPDFADSLFIAKHCFSYGGDTTVDSVSVVRVAFSPVTDLTEPDLSGVIMLRADDYAIWAVDQVTTAVPKNVASEIASVRAVTRFQDILPGIAVISNVESFLAPGPHRMRSEPKVVSRGEVQRLVELKWKKGPP
jgi:hypothetical protein